MNNLAIIPARGGSKRISGKNIKEFLGKPIIAYSIEAARTSGLFSQIIVSTDDEQIKAVAEQFGAQVPFMRSKVTSSDHATIQEVIEEVLSQLEEDDLSFDRICCIYATAPFVTAVQLQKGLDTLNSQDAYTVVPVQRFRYPVQRGLVINDDGFLEMAWPEYAKVRSQDLTTIYHDAGTFYWAKTIPYRKEGRFFSSRAKFMILDDDAAHDIDEPEDWEIAEKKFRMKNHD